MRGSCLCGQIRYEATRLCSPIQHCACHTCRKAHAAAFATGAGVRHDDFAWTQGQHLLKAYESTPGKLRYFCSHCGTQLAAQFAGRDTLVLRVATLDDDPGQVPEREIWASHEVPWLHYGPDLVAYPEWQPGRGG
jgi:hypothetical protein